MKPSLFPAITRILSVILRIIGFIAAIILLFALLVVGSFYLNTIPEQNWEMRNLPGVVDVEKVTSSSQYLSAWAGYDCMYASYTITGNFAQTLEQQGLNYLSHNTTPRKNGLAPKSGMQEWAETPAKNLNMEALDANRGCEDHKTTPVDAEALLKEPGNFYALSKGEKTLFVVSPKRKTAVYLYYSR